jgi:predicted DNA-binding WGR domain protein
VIAVYLEKRDPEKRQARFYAMHVTPTLFGDWTLVREWGQIGTRGRVRMDWFDSEEEATQALAKVTGQKLRRGYQTLG